MAVMAGKDGEIKLGTNKIGYIDNFSINVNQATLEVSQIGDQWKQFIVGPSDWSGSISGTLDYGDTAQKEVVDNLLTPDGEAFTCEFKVGPALILTGDVHFSSGGITGSHGDKVAISFNFQGTGALSVKGVEA